MLAESVLEGEHIVWMGGMLEIETKDKRVGRNSGSTFAKDLSCVGGCVGGGALATQQTEQLITQPTEHSSNKTFKHSSNKEKWQET